MRPAVGRGRARRAKSARFSPAATWHGDRCRAASIDLIPPKSAPARKAPLLRWRGAGHGFFWPTGSGFGGVCKGGFPGERAGNNARRYKETKPMTHPTELANETRKIEAYRVSEHVSTPIEN